MRITIVTPDYAGATEFTGGIGTLYAALAPALVQCDQDVRVVAPTTGPPRELVLDEVSIELINVSPRPTFRALSFGVEAARALETQPSDVVLASEYGAGAWRYSRRPRAGRLVTHLHTSTTQVSELSQWALTRRLHPGTVLQSRLERRQTERSTALIASTRRILDWTGELWRLGGIPAAVLPNPVEVDRIGRLREGPLPDGFPARGPVVAFSGRLEPRKGVHILVEAMHTVWDAVPEAQLVVMGPDDGYGRGLMSEHLRATAGSRSGALHILGVQPPERLIPALAAAEVVALPSLWENYSLAALEALAVGAALVVTTGSGFDEIVRDRESAITVSPGEREPLGDAILTLLREPQLRSRLGRGAQGVADAHRPATVARRYVEQLEQFR